MVMTTDEGYLVKAFASAATASFRRGSGGAGCGERTSQLDAKQPGITSLALPSLMLWQ